MDSAPPRRRSPRWQARRGRRRGRARRRIAARPRRDRREAACTTRRARRRRGPVRRRVPRRRGEPGVPRLAFRVGRVAEAPRVAVGPREVEESAALAGEVVGYVVREERVEGAKLLGEEPALADRVLALLIHVLRNGLRPHLLSMLAAVLVGVPNPPRLRARPVSAPRLMALEEAARLARAPLAPRLVASGGTDVTLWRLEIADDDVPRNGRAGRPAAESRLGEPRTATHRGRVPLAAFSNPPLTDGQSDPPSPGGHPPNRGPRGCRRHHSRRSRARSPCSGGRRSPRPRARWPCSPPRR